MPVCVGVVPCCPVFPPQGVDLDAESVLVFLQQWRSLFRVKPKPTRGSIDVWVTRQDQGCWRGGGWKQKKSTHMGIEPMTHRNSIRHAIHYANVGLKTYDFFFV